MPNFVYDGTSLPSTKSDARPLQGPANQSLTAAELNTLIAALTDLRGGLTAAQYIGLASTPAAPVSGAGAARLRLNGSDLEISINGAAYGRFQSAVVDIADKFGLVGDDLTDNTAGFLAMRTWLRANDGAVLWLKPGVYQHKNPYMFAGCKNFRLIAYGAALRSAFNWIFGTDFAAVNFTAGVFDDDRNNFAPVSNGMLPPSHTHAMYKFASVAAGADTITLRAPKVIPYDNQTGVFVYGETVTGGTSGATGTVMARNADPYVLSTGTLHVAVTSGTFVNGETLTGSITGGVHVSAAPYNAIASFYPGLRTLLYGFAQDTLGSPPGARYHEWVEVKQVDTTLNTVQFTRPLKYKYDQRWWDDGVWSGHPRAIPLTRAANSVFNQPYEMYPLENAVIEGLSARDHALEQNDLTGWAASTAYPLVNIYRTNNVGARFVLTTAGTSHATEHNLDNWVGNTAYTVGQIRCNGTRNRYICTVAGTSSAVAGNAGPTGGSGTTGIVDGAGALRWDYYGTTASVTDGTAVWARLSRWSTATAFVIGDRVQNNARVYVCTAAGTSGTTGPTSTGTSIADGSGALRWDYVAPADPASQSRGKGLVYCAGAINIKLINCDFGIMTPTVCRTFEAFNSDFGYVEIDKIIQSALLDTCRADYITGATACDNTLVRACEVYKQFEMGPARYIRVENTSVYCDDANDAHQSVINGDHVIVDGCRFFRADPVFNELPMTGGGETSLTAIACTPRTITCALGGGHQPLPTLTEGCILYTGTLDDTGNTGAHGNRGVVSNIYWDGTNNVIEADFEKTPTPGDVFYFRKPLITSHRDNVVIRSNDIRMIGQAQGPEGVEIYRNNITRAATQTVKVPLPPPVFAWQPNTVYEAVGTLVYNSGKTYSLTVAGTSANTGGPVHGTGAVAEGGCTWTFLNGLPYPLIQLPVAMDILSVTFKVNTAGNVGLGFQVWPTSGTYQGVYNIDTNKTGMRKFDCFSQSSVRKSTDDICPIGYMSGVTLPFDTKTGNFTVGQVVTGATSGAVGVVESGGGGGASGTLVLGRVNGTFLDNEAITDPITGSALVNGVAAQSSPLSQWWRGLYMIYTGTATTYPTGWILIEGVSHA